MEEFQSHTRVRSDRGVSGPPRTLPLDPPMGYFMLFLYYHNSYYYYYYYY